MKKLIGFLTINALVLATPQSSYAQLLPVMPQAPIETRGVINTPLQTTCKDFPNSQAFIYFLDGNQSINGGFPFITGSHSGSQTLIIQDFSLTQSREPNDDLIGVGVRLYITVNKDTQNVRTVGIPWLALEAQRGELEATVNLQVIGIQNPKVLEKYPNLTDLSFSSLVNLYQVIDRIKEVVCSNETTLTPQVLARPASRQH